MPPQLVAAISAHPTSAASTIMLVSCECLIGERNTFARLLSWVLGVSPETKRNVAKEEGDIRWSGMISKHVCDEHGHWWREGGGSEREKSCAWCDIALFNKSCIIQIYVGLFSKKIVLFYSLIHISKNATLLLNIAIYICLNNAIFWHSAIKYYSPDFSLSHYHHHFATAITLTSVLRSILNQWSPPSSFATSVSISENTSRSATLVFTARPCRRTPRMVTAMAASK